jgi:hypothetical protein
MSRGFLVPILLPADPATAMEAATKQYVDSVAGGGGGAPNWPDGYPTYDPRYVNLTGDTMTGPLVMTVPASGEQLKLVHPASATWNFVGFFDNAGVTRNGYVGATNVDFGMRLHADRGPAVIYAPTGQIIALYGGGIENLRCTGDAVLVGTTDPAAANNQPGIILNRSTCWQSIANNAVSTPTLTLNKVGAGVGSGSDFAHFRTNNNTIGSITRNAQQAAVLYNTTSDYRLKNDLGAIPDPIRRVRRLRPIRVTWKDDPTEQVVDAFLAHEVAEVVPDAVTGEQDAVDDDGNIVPQQMDASRLIPVLTAALQELTELVDDQRQELDRLREEVDFLRDQIGELLP